jgi:ubiquinone biosynthesis protein UbiJ
VLDRFSLGALNHLLSQADWARAKLLLFAGRRARLAMPPFQLDLAIREDGYVEAAPAGEPPDVTMTLPADTPLRALQGQDQIIAAARVEGNAHLATELSFVLRNLRWDAEEDLSRAVGDIAAHRMVQTASAIAGWHAAAARNLAENVAEYIGEENPLVARPQDVATFSGEVAELRDKLSQLEKRIDKLSLST